MTEIYLAENHLLLETGYHDPQIHSHSAAHILLGLHGDMRVITEKETILCRGALLPSGTAHTVDSFGRPLLVFLLDVTSTVSEQIQRMAALDRGTAECIALSYRTLAAGNPADGYEKFFMEVMYLLGSTVLYLFSCRGFLCYAFYRYSAPKDLLKNVGCAFFPLLSR